MSAPTEMILPAPDADGITDFSMPVGNIRSRQFRIDGDIFTIVPGLPAISLMTFMELAEQPTDKPEQAREVFKEMFSLVLVDDSANMFLGRLEDKERPIRIEQVQQIIPYVLEKLGLRPTAQSGNSSDGPDNPESGTRSAVSAQLPESPSAVYPFPLSSTSSTGS